MKKNKQLIKQLKIQLLFAAFSVAVAFIMLVTTTYAWYVSQDHVEGKTATISASADGAVLQICVGELPDHQGEAATVAAVEGHGISPASTDDLINWFVPALWGDHFQKVNTYQKVTLETDASGFKDGTYNLGGTDYYAYALGVYNLYAMRDTGHADVYFDGAAAGGAIQVTRTGEDGTVTDKVAASMRVGITINDVLVAVYAPIEPTGAGNDFSYSGSDDSNGWRVVKDNGTNGSDTTTDATYKHISGSDDQSWALVKNANGVYETPTASDICLASGVDYNGVVLKVYVWMEGTDADCISSIVTGDESLYNVTIHLVGLSS